MLVSTTVLFFRDARGRVETNSTHCELNFSSGTEVSLTHPNLSLMGWFQEDKEYGLECRIKTPLELAFILHGK